MLSKRVITFILLVLPFCYLFTSENSDTNQESITSVVKFDKFEYDIRRNTELSPSLILDYNVKGNAALKSFSFGEFAIGFSSLGYANIQEFNRVISQSKIGLQYQNGYKLFNGLDLKGYYVIGSANMNIETRQDSLTNEFTFQNKCASASLEFEVPYSDIIADAVKKATGYYRGGTPVRIRAEYMAPGMDQNNDGTLGRFDYMAKVEWSFKEWFMLKLQGNLYHIIDQPQGMIQDNWSHKIQFGAQLGYVIKHVPLFHILYKPTEYSGKNYIYYQQSYGRNAPDFQKIPESSIGFSVGF